MNQLSTKMVVVHKMLIFLRQLFSNVLLFFHKVIQFFLHYIKASAVFTFLTFLKEFATLLSEFFKNANFDGINFEIIIEVDVPLVIHIDFVNLPNVHLLILIEIILSTK